MPEFHPGDRVRIAWDPEETYTVVRQDETTCSCDGCRVYVLEADGYTDRRHHNDLRLAPSLPPDTRPAQTLQSVRRGTTYHIASGPASGNLVTAREIYSGSPRLVIGPLYTLRGVRLRNSYEVRLSDLGGTATLPPSTLPEALRYPTSSDSRWNVGPGVRATCMCATCQGHTCEDRCYDYGCTFEDPDNCRLSQRQPWNYREPLTFWGDGPLFLGTELELQTRTHSRNQEAIRVVQRHLADKVMIKGDGSIEEDGIELAMHPMTYAWMRENFPARDMFSELRDLGVRPHRSCGMHIHVSRAGFSSPKHIYIWQKLFYRNVREMTTLSRREPDRLDRWATFSDTYHRQWSKHFAKGAIGGQRYVALNMNNAETVELRFFASTLTPQQFWGALGLADASVNYTRELDSRKIIKEKAWGFDAFKSFVAAHDEYKPLTREIARLGL